MAIDERRVALITGASRGLGVEIARQLIVKGLRVIVTGRSLDHVAEVSTTLGGAATPLRLDVTDPAAVLDTVLAAMKLTGRIDVLVNNAGITDGDNKAVAPDFAQVVDVLNTNLLGAWRMSEAVAPHMVAAGYGRIVNVTSTLGSLSLMASGSEPAYRVSKAALNALTRVLAVDLAGTGVLVNAASPGWTRTDMGGPRAPRSVEDGADTPVWLATLEEGSTMTGGLYYDRAPLEW